MAYYCTTEINYNASKYFYEVSNVYSVRNDIYILNYS